MVVPRLCLVTVLFGMGPMLLAGNAAKADELSSLYQRLQAQPRDVALNLEYAAAAEKTGKLKWALPAYERALGAAPGNSEARRGIERVRNRLRAEQSGRNVSE